MEIQTYSEVSAQRRNIQALHSLISTIGLNPPRPEQVLPVVVFMAFTLEAYVNNLGYKHTPDWDKNERKPWRQKIKILHENRSKEVEWDSAPLNFAAELFSVRDRLAHGKPERIVGKRFKSQNEAEHYIISSEFDPPWFSELDAKWYSRAKVIFFELMEYLAVMHGLSPENYLHGSTNIATRTFKFSE